MIDRPLPEIRAAAARLLDKGATVVAGHFAHVFHGVEGPVLYDLGDFIDDYATHPVLRNDLGLLFLLTLDAEGPVRLEALPLKLDYCHTRLASGADEALDKAPLPGGMQALGGRTPRRTAVAWSSDWRADDTATQTFRTQPPAA